MAIAAVVLVAVVAVGDDPVVLSGGGTRCWESGVCVCVMACFSPFALKSKTTPKPKPAGGLRSFTKSGDRLHAYHTHSAARSSGFLSPTSSLWSHGDHAHNLNAAHRKCGVLTSMAEGRPSFSYRSLLLLQLLLALLHKHSLSLLTTTTGTTTTTALNATGSQSCRTLQSSTL